MFPNILLLLTSFQSLPIVLHPGLEMSVMRSMFEDTTIF